MQTDPITTVSAVVIGRNEGPRLETCLRALRRQIDRVVYVDSGSDDGSVALARELGAEVVALDMSIPFTAARARNAGCARATALFPETRFVQFIDGDCELVAGWMPAGVAELAETPDLAAVCGRVRERHPEVSLYNRILDEEWDGPAGDVTHCGGIALMRRSMFETVGGFREDLIAGEEPELCLRLRRQGWSVRRLPRDMTLHDAAMTRFSQWWRRTTRAGYTYGQGVALHGASAERYRIPERRRALLWGIAVPAGVVLAGVVAFPWGLLLAAIWPLQIWRMTRRGMSLPGAVMNVLGKFPEAWGVLRYWRDRMTRRKAGLIEYK